MSRTTGPIRLAGSTLKDRAHICAFFNSADEARRVLLPFVQEGLELAEKALHTIDPRQRAEHIRWLTSSGIDVAACEKELIEILDWTDSHLRDGQFDHEWTPHLLGKGRRRRERKGFPLVRFVSRNGATTTA